MEGGGVNIGFILNSCNGFFMATFLFYSCSAWASGNSSQSRSCSSVIWLAYAAAPNGSIPHVAAQAQLYSYTPFAKWFYIWVSLMAELSMCTSGIVYQIIISLSFCTEELYRSLIRGLQPKTSILIISWNISLKSKKKIVKRSKMIGALLSCNKVWGIWMCSKPFQPCYQACPIQ